MADHKSYCDCDCKRCTDAKAILNKGKAKRFLPASVRAEFEEKRAKAEELELWKGNIRLECPKCHHWSYMKIGPVMTCPNCCHKIS